MTQPSDAGFASPELEIFREAPPEPRRKGRTVIFLFLFLLLLWWSFEGAKIRPRELIYGIPEIAVTIGRMLPPDFSKVTDAKSYFLPEGMPLAKLLLPLPASESQKRVKQRWWDNTFPQTIVGATVETIQMALAGTFLALILAFPVAFLAARNTSPHPSVYHVTRIILDLLRTIPDLALGLLFVAAVGLGAFAGTLALFIHTATVLSKLLSEAVEGIDEGVVEAIRATGSPAAVSAWTSHPFCCQDSGWL